MKITFFGAKATNTPDVAAIRDAVTNKNNKET